MRNNESKTLEYHQMIGMTKLSNSHLFPVEILDYTSSRALSSLQRTGDGETPSSCGEARVYMKRPAAYIGADNTADQ